MKKIKIKSSPRPSFDQDYNLITCIPKRAFIWSFSLSCVFFVFFTVARRIQSEA